MITQSKLNLQTNQHRKSLLKQFSVNNLVNIEEIIQDDIQLDTQKNLEKTLQNSSSSNFQNQVILKEYPFKELTSDLSIKWNQEKSNIKNTQNWNNLQDDQDFNYKNQSNEQESGYTLIDEDTAQRIITNKTIKENSKNTKNISCNKIILTDKDRKSKTNKINIKDRQVKKQDLNQFLKNQCVSPNKNSFIKNKRIKKNLDYLAQQDKYLTNFFANKRFLVSSRQNKSKSNKKTKELYLASQLQNSKQNKFQQIKQNKSMKNRHTFTNDSQKNERVDTFSCLITNNNRFKIRPQTVKYGCSYSNKQNIIAKNSIEIEKKRKKIEYSNLSQCQIYALINSNINENKKIAKFMQINKKFYNKYHDSQLCQFINLRKIGPNIKRRQKNIKELQTQTSQFNYKLIQQNQQNFTALNYHSSVKQQQLQIKNLQMEKNLMKLQEKVEKKLPYLVEMGVNFKLKQKKKEKAKY